MLNHEDADPPGLCSYFCPPFLGSYWFWSPFRYRTRYRRYFCLLFTRGRYVFFPWLGRGWREGSQVSWMLCKIKGSSTSQAVLALSTERTLEIGVCQPLLWITNVVRRTDQDRAWFTFFYIIRQPPAVFCIVYLWFVMYSYILSMN